MTRWDVVRMYADPLLKQLEQALLKKHALAAVVLAYDLHQELMNRLQEEMKEELEKVIGHE
uniref:Uncharacterized protein n=1 Tax=viral metagenome TaxID=1070528 RepID=A0A6H2A5V2_9ZZZZ